MKPGDEQSIVFKQGDLVPFWMSEQEQEEEQKDEVLEKEKIKWKFKKAELIVKLWEKGILAQGKLVDVQKFAME